MRPSRATDHPRVSGEHDALDNLVFVGSGSPPRQRGALPTQPAPDGHVRITPASAGSTRPSHGRGPAASDHPRVSGEHCTSAAGSRPNCGSPPRQRGAQRHAPGHLLVRRITPASAGSTRCPPARSTPPTDHPRVSGEHATDDLASAASFGSPPRQRGAHGADRGDGALQRITPASAGSTLHDLRLSGGFALS